MLFLCEKVYYGICETIFKLRYANHKNSFNGRNRNSDTELCNEFWKIKDNKHSANITWKSWVDARHITKVAKNVHYA